MRLLITKYYYNYNRADNKYAKHYDNQWKQVIRVVINVDVGITAITIGV